MRLSCYTGWMSFDIVGPWSGRFDDVRHLGIAIGREFGSLHVGVLFKLEGEQAKLCHLAWHHLLLEDSPKPSYAWVQSGLSDDDRRLVAVAASRVVRRHARQVSYSPNYDQHSYFEAETLRFMRVAPGEGLTCATFVLALHKALGIQLLDEATWPSRVDDATWRDCVIETLLRHGGGQPEVQEHIDAIKRQTPTSRYRPEEVVVGVGRSDAPVPFGVAITDASRVIQTLDACGGSP